MEGATGLLRRRLFCFESFFLDYSAFLSLVYMYLVVGTLKRSAVSDMSRDMKIL